MLCINLYNYTVETEKENYKTMLSRLASDKLLKHLDKLEYGSLEMRTPDGRSHQFQGRKPGASAQLDIHDWGVFSNLATGGDIAFAQDYKKGLWDSDNIQNLLALGIKNDSVINPYVFGNKLYQMVARLSYLFRPNSIKGSKDNIHAHYDIGNDFYKLWLDPTMTYSSALYKNTQDTLEDAQLHKYNRILSCLNDTKGSLLEIGCGWGGFAEQAMKQGDFDIKGITISEKQFDYAKKRLGGKATIALEDYRHQTGTFDHIVSIEMFEAVGEAYWKQYFDQIKRLLSKSGKAVIQTITIDDHHFDTYRKSGDFIRSYIFPGGMLPSVSRFKQEAKKAGLRVENTFEFGQDYARTLTEWLDRFDAQKDTIKALGLDDAFMRLWHFYFAGCIAGFSTGRTNVMQAEVVHA